MEKSTFRNTLLLLLAAMIWGASFVAQSVGMDYVGPLTFNGTRCLIGGLVLLPLVFRQKAHLAKNGGVGDKKALLTGGVLCGLCLFVASSLQQYGILYTTVGKSGFITAFYIVLVPVFGLFLKKKTGPFIWGGVAIALIGLYLLCVNESFLINIGDVLTLLCAVAYTCHILVIDHYAKKADAILLACTQFFISGFLGVLGALLTERPAMMSILSAWSPLLYSGILSCGVAYTIQIIVQRNMDPTVASLVLSLESCFAVLSGWLLLQQSLTARELVGCGLLFSAILLAQIPAKKPAAAAQEP